MPEHGLQGMKVPQVAWKMGNSVLTGGSGWNRSCYTLYNRSTQSFQRINSIL